MNLLTAMLLQAVPDDRVASIWEVVKDNLKQEFRL